MALDDIPEAIRYAVYERDNYLCRFCGVGNAYAYNVHHVHYRSEGGPHELWNLVLLCESCHRRAHSNKRVWQPLLLEVVKRPGITVLQLRRWSRAAHLKAQRARKK